MRGSRLVVSGALLVAALTLGVSGQAVATVFPNTAELTAAPPATGDPMLGQSVAISADGLTVAVGAPYANGGHGAVYVYSQTAGVWNSATQTAVLIPAETVSGFGQAVAVSADGSTIVVGAADGTTGAGGVYVFTEPSSGAWANASTSAVAEATGGDALGASVAVSADGATIVAGAPGYGGGANGTGAAEVLTKGAAGGWSLPGVAVLVPSEAAANDVVGKSVAITGDGGTVVVGAPGTSSEAGTVYAFTKPATGWQNSAQGIALPASADAGDQLGYSVSISGDGNVIAAGKDESKGGEGAIDVYEKPAGSWVQRAELTPGDGGNDFLGTSVAVSENGATIAGGADSYMLGGAEYLFVEGNGGWVNGQHEIDSPYSGPDTAGGDQLGAASAISGDGGTVVVGAPSHSTNTGAAYVFSESKDVSATTLVCSPLQVPVGGSSACTATVSGAGAVSGRVLIGGISCMLVAGSCHVALTFTTPGARAIVAQYIGDSTLYPSASNPIVVTVQTPTAPPPPVPVVLGRIAVLGRSRNVGVLLGCKAAKTCSATVEIEYRGNVVGVRAALRIRSGDAVLESLRVTAAVRRAVSVVIVNDAGTTSGSSSLRLLVPAGHMSIAAAGFVDSRRRLGILIACGGRRPCAGKLTIRSGRRAINPGGSRYSLAAGAYGLVRVKLGHGRPPRVVRVQPTGERVSLVAL